MLWAAKSFGLYERLKVLWAQGSRCYNELLTVDDMNDFELWAKGSRIYEQVRVVDDINDSRWWPQDSKCYVKVSIVDDMNDSRFRELRALGGRNSSEM